MQLPDPGTEGLLQSRTPLLLLGLRVERCRLFRIEEKQVLCPVIWPHDEWFLPTRVVGHVELRASGNHEVTVLRPSMPGAKQIGDEQGHR